MISIERQIAKIWGKKGGAYSCGRSLQSLPSIMITLPWTVAVIRDTEDHLLFSY